MRFLASLLVCILIGGCVGASSKTGASSSSMAPAPAAVVTSDTGSITGSVVDQEAAPIARAEVALGHGGNQSVNTDNVGKFTFNGLAPGEYTVTTQKLGYEAAAKRVTVALGEPTQVSFTLQSIAVDSEPYSESKQYDHVLEGPDFYSPGLTVYHPQSFPVNLSKGAQDVVVSMAWLANTPTTARYMYQGVSYGDAKNSTYGKSPLSMNISGLEVAKAKDKATVTWYLTFACPSLNANYPFCIQQNPEAAIPVVAYQQKVTHYSTVFYNGPAPEGYTGLPS